MKKTAVIIANGNMPGPRIYRDVLRNAEFIICADGGYINILETGVKPDIIIGDFDSIPQAMIPEITGMGIKIGRYPSHKNESDLEIAVRAAESISPDEIIILGALGKRLDHTLFNILLLFQNNERNIPIKILDDEVEIFRPENRTVIDKPAGTVVSLVPISDEVRNVTLKGFEYQLESESLILGHSRGLSNVISESPCVVEFDEGNMIIIVNHEKE